MSLCDKAMSRQGNRLQNISSRACVFRHQAAAFRAESPSVNCRTVRISVGWRL
jgi:hypothetical protein